MEINELIKEVSGRQLEILLELKKLNRKAYLHMKQFSKSWKVKYKEMWRKPFWRRARLLLKEYFEIENGLTCPVCNRKIMKRFILHHEVDFYNFLNYFSPNYVQLVHPECHNKIHKK